MLEFANVYLQAVETSQGSGHRCSFAGSEDVIK